MNDIIEIEDPIVKEARKNLLGRKVSYEKHSGNIVRISNLLGRPDGEFLIAELDNGIIVNIELLREEIDGKSKKITEFLHR